MKCLRNDFFLLKIELFGRSIRGLSRGYRQGSSWDDGEDGEDGSGRQQSWGPQ